MQERNKERNKERKMQERKMQEQFARQPVGGRLLLCHSTIESGWGVSLHDLQSLHTPLLLCDQHGSSLVLMYIYYFYGVLFSAFILLHLPLTLGLVYGVVFTVTFYLLLFWHDTVTVPYFWPVDFSLFYLTLLMYFDSRFLYRVMNGEFGSWEMVWSPNSSRKAGPIDLPLLHSSTTA